MGEILRQFGHRVRSLRLQSGMTQEELAHEAQLDRSYIGGVERGERNVSLRNIAKLASALGVSIADIFADIEQDDITTIVGQQKR